MRSQFLPLWLQRTDKLLEINASSNLNLKSVFICHSKNPGALKNYVKSTLPVFYKLSHKIYTSGLQCLTVFYIVINILSLLLRLLEKNKKTLFKMLLAIGNVPHHPRIWWTYIRRLMFLCLLKTLPFYSLWLKSNVHFQIF